MKLLGYNISVQTYTQRKAIAVDKYCNGFTVRNLGDQPIKVNGILLQPTLVAGASGESVSIGGNYGEIYRGKIDVVFVDPAGTNPMAEVTQKFYLPDQIEQ